MTNHHFDTLTPQAQTRTLLDHGIFIGNRKEVEGPVLLFGLNDFYVEVFFNTEGDEIMHTQSRTHVAEWLQDAQAC